MDTTDFQKELTTLEGKVAVGQRAMEQRDLLIRRMVDAGIRQADAWRMLNQARSHHGQKEVTRAAVEAILRRTAAPEPVASVPDPF